MRRKNVLIGLLLWGILTTILPGAALAVETNRGFPTDGIKAEGKVGKSGQVSIQSTTYLANGSSSIEVTGSGQVRVSGNSQAYSPVDVISVDLYLQRWNGSSWVDIANAGRFSNYNATSTTGSSLVNVTPGYYYRTKAVHWINEEQTHEESTSYSSYVYVK